MKEFREVRDVAEYLKQHGIKPSVIRMRVMQYLASTREHPTADRIYRELSREMPTLSKTSVYNTLKTFTSGRVAREIMIEENEIRYDAHTDSHGHFKCESCGSLTDIPVTSLSYDISALRPAEVREEHVYIRGICGRCASSDGKG